ncbi:MULTISPECIES: GNAT family N-acetyltransferase [Dyadobacter]|uniref:GNAT family N-acetyltransferase n=1 Tax=Dyadobacter TaxID=120831 RepID=UPI00286BDF76|nr:MULTISPECIES: GNAT family N-acetyltransferase [Dyadobacter]
MHRSGILAGFIGVAEDKIEMLFIHPDYFRQGLGQRLCLFAIQKLNARKVDVNEANPDAWAFYKKLGFDLLGRSEKDPSGNDFPILHLELSAYTN